MGRCDYLDSESEPEHPFAVLWFFMRLFYGPLFWPIMLVNAIGWAWCVYQGMQGFDDGMSLLWRLFTPTG